MSLPNYEQQESCDRSARQFERNRLHDEMNSCFQQREQTMRFDMFAGKDTLGCMTITNGGGEVTLNGCGKVVEMRDAAGRDFKFGYDPNGALNFVKNESGTFVRERTADGCYTDNWRGENGGVWIGKVSVNEHGYSFEDKTSKTSYSLNGAKMIDRLDDCGKATHRETFTPDGHKKVQDLSDFFMPHDRQTRTIDHAPSRTFDHDGRMVGMTDGAGRTFKFGKFDEHGQPNEITNLSGTWEKFSADGWRNQRTGDVWRGEVKLDSRGAYGYADLSGKHTAYLLPGVETTDYGGVVNFKLPDGSTKSRFEDDFGDAKAFRLNPQFHVSHGATDGFRLNADKEIIAWKAGDVHAELGLQDKQAVGAFQDGIVVYSSRKPAADDHRAHVDTGTVIGLSKADLDAIEQYRRLNPHDENVVVVQTYDKKTGGVRYEMYSGLSEANVVDGDRIRAGQVIGRVGEDQRLNYGVRRNSIHGESIDILD